MQILELDHLIVAAQTLGEGEAWLAPISGVRPGNAGSYGVHETMGTHNACYRLGPACYLELIAIEPGVAAPVAGRWFGLDRADLSERLRHGPTLLHWVMRGRDIATLARANPEFGEPLQMERGQFHWHITVRKDRQLQQGGALPSLIEWKDQNHPALHLPDQGLRLDELEVGLDLSRLPPWLATQRGPFRFVHSDTSRLGARVSTPHGPQELGQFGAEVDAAEEKKSRAGATR